MTSITIPNSVNGIGNQAFYGCTNLSSIIIPSSVYYIGKGAFLFCSSLTSITIPESVTSIGSGTFAYCTSLASVTIPQSVTSIGGDNIYGGAFGGCTSLTTIIIPNSVTSIGNQAFLGCDNLKTVKIGSGMKSIGNYAFMNCQELTDVYCFPENVPSTNSDVFKNSFIEYATLHVPASSMEIYRTREPWKSFKEIKSLTDEDIPVTPDPEKCATPTIAFVDGELVFSCETEGVEYVSEVSSAETKKYYDNKVKIGGTYTITVYATKAGWENSDVATLEFTIGAGGEVCDVNKDGAVDVADIATIIEEMAARARVAREE